MEEKKKSFIEKWKEKKIIQKEYKRIQANSQSYNSSKKDKIMVFNHENPDIFHRYFYTFLKFFSLAGYTIYFPNFNLKFYKDKVYNKNLESWNYYNLIFEEGLIQIGPVPKNSKIDFEIREDQLSHDYFTPFFKKSAQNKKHFHIPMSMHPMFYHLKLWDAKIEDKVNKKHSIFMIGNYTREHYSGFEKTPFKMESRVQVVDFLESNKIKSAINDLDQLKAFIKSEEDNACIILDSKVKAIHPNELRQIIAEFHFYIVLPGVIMPFSHNLIEAISAGSIPIIHKEYANLLVPHLKHLETAIIFDDLNDLKSKIELAYLMDLDLIHKIKSNLSDYYDRYLTPSSVVDNLISSKAEIYYLQAEHPSVKVLQENLK